MKLLATLTVLSLAASSLAQSPATFTDPANLRGERVTPLTGRELPIDQGARGLQQLLRKLNTRASILNIVAHPDDEDGGMMALYSRGLGARVADISLTRGEGGQNAVTGDFEDALGLLRTQELLSSDRYPGVDQFFGTEVDFGFSKTKEESFAKWTHDRVLYDVVRAIRLYRPLVLTSTWIGGVTDGHGQHQVSGEIAQEAFIAAGDPKVFPELTAEGILPWQPLKIYARVPMQSISERGLFDYATGEYTPARFTNYVTGEVTTIPPTTDIVVHEGTPDPLLADETGKPRSYVQFARIGLGLQRSQVGPGVRNAPAGAFDVAYHLYGSTLCPNSISPKLCHPERSAQRAVEGPATKPILVSSSHLSNPNLDPGFFNDIDTTIMGIEDLAPDAFPTDLLSSISRAIQTANDKFDPAHPEQVAPALAVALQDMDQLIPEVQKGRGDPTAISSALHELRVKRAQLNDALILALGLELEATSPRNNSTEHTYVEVATRLSQQSQFTWTGVTESLLNSDQHYGDQTRSSNNNGVVTRHQPYLTKLIADSSLTFSITRPFFKRSGIEQPVYQISKPDLRLAPQTPPALTAWATLNNGTVTIQIGRIVHNEAQPLNIVPELGVALSATAQVLPSQSNHFHLSVSARFAQDNPDPLAKLELGLPPQWSVNPVAHSANPAQPSTTFDVTAPEQRRGEIIVTAAARPINGHAYTEGYRPIGYGDLPRTNYFTPATTRIVPVDLKFPTHHNIAYLPGTGDSIPEALASINLTPTILTVADLTPTKLAAYDTVILGVRAYNAHPDLHGAPTLALLDYARNGGNVVVQYQTTEFTAADAPYPLALGSNEKVVDETAPVQLLNLTSPLLTTPNHLTSADFNNWIEERGHGFLSTWDPHYTALTETHDPGQSPQRGGLITTPLGKGHWTYVAFALYRQLPEAVPGAYRLFLNLLNP
jgi:LmbE family N-acetylglucosaminyl deacetylase